MTTTNKKRKRGLRYHLHMAALPLIRKIRIKPLCRMGLNQLDRKLEKYMNFDNGVFIEAGAYNGVDQSNTYYFEAIRGWKGILVEPIPELYKKCLKNRPSALIYNTALVGPEWPNSTVQMKFSGLMSTIRSESKNGLDIEDHIEKGLEIQNIQASYEVEAKASTLSSIIDHSGHQQIDLLSLDVEGFEAEALKGLDLRRHRPTYICIETRNQSEIESIIGEYYSVEAILIHYEKRKDVLFKCNNPIESH